MTWYCGHSTWATFYIAQKVNLSSFSTLNISFSRSSMNVDEPILWGIKSSVSSERDDFVKYKSYGNNDVFSGSGIISLDISDKSGEYYIAMWGHPDGVFDMDVTKIWLE